MTWRNCLAAGAFCFIAGVILGGIASAVTQPKVFSYETLRHGRLTHVINAGLRDEYRALKKQQGGQVEWLIEGGATVGRLNSPEE